jgi:NitT/TauT family transport system substrate-binding protein
VANPDEAAATIAPHVGVSPAVMKSAFAANPDLAKGYTLKVDTAGLTNLSELMVGAGQISEPIDWAATLDQQYLPDAARAKF